MKKILIMGLPGAGKTTLAEILAPRINAVWYNADGIRKNINKDLGFEPDDRIEQARRMGWLCDRATEAGHYSIADFVCPTVETREAFNADFVIWIDRIDQGRFEDTNELFQKPKKYDVRVTAKGTPEEWVEKVIKKLKVFDTKKPTALFIGRYQPFHDGHKTIFMEGIKRSGQICIAVRDTYDTNDKNPFNFEDIKARIEEGMGKLMKKVTIIQIPNISDVFYGRGVGYNIEQIEVSLEIEKISATEIRKKLK